jgi:hypothetical protein
MSCTVVGRVITYTLRYHIIIELFSVCFSRTWRFKVGRHRKGGIRPNCRHLDHLSLPFLLLLLRESLNATNEIRGDVEHESPDGGNAIPALDDIENLHLQEQYIGRCYPCTLGPGKTKMKMKLSVRKVYFPNA